MNITDKLNLLSKNKKASKEKYKKEKIRDKYMELKELYDEVESSLKHGYVNIVVKGYSGKQLTKKYFFDCWVGCSGDCITEYVFKMTEGGIRKLEKDYLKVKEAFDNYVDK